VTDTITISSYMAEHMRVAAAISYDRSQWQIE